MHLCALRGRPKLSFIHRITGEDDICANFLVVDINAAIKSDVIDITSLITNDNLNYIQLSCFFIPIPHNLVINDFTLSFLGYQLTFVDGAFTILPIVICASSPLFLLSDVPPRVRSCECERIHEVVIPFLSSPVILPTHKVITSSPPLTRSTIDAKFTFSLLDISLQMR